MLFRARQLDWPPRFAVRRWREGWFVSRGLSPAHFGRTIAKFWAASQNYLSAKAAWTKRINCSINSPGRTQSNKAPLKHYPGRSSPRLRKPTRRIESFSTASEAADKTAFQEDSIMQPKIATPDTLDLLIHSNPLEFFFDSLSDLGGGGYYRMSEGPNRLTTTGLLG